MYYPSNEINGADVTAQLICVFVFVYAKNRFSHNEVQLSFLKLPSNNCLPIQDSLTQIIANYKERQFCSSFRQNDKEFTTFRADIVREGVPVIFNAILRHDLKQYPRTFGEDALLF